MRKNKSQIGSGIILSYVYLGISMLAGLLFTPRMLKLMGQNEYGLYSLGSSIITYLSFLGLGLESALVKYTAKYVAEQNKEAENHLGGMYLVMYAIIGVTALIVGLILSNNLDLFSATLTKEETDKLRIIVLILTCNLAVSFPMSIFGACITAHERFTFRKTVSIIREITLPFVVLIALSYDYRAIGLVVIHSAFNLLVLLTDYFYATRILHYAPKFVGFDKALLKEIAKYTVFVFIGTVVDRISNATNSMVLAAVSGTAAIAVYNVGAQLYGYFLNFSSSIAGFFFPKIVGMTCQNASNEELSELFIRVGRIQLYVVLLICSGFILFGQSFISLWAGEEYAQSYWIAVICMVPTVINRSQSLGTQILLAKNKHQFRAIMFSLITLLDIAISIPLAKLYEGVGAAIGTAIATLLGPILIMNIYYKRVIGLQIGTYWKSTLPIILKVACLAAVCGMAFHALWQTNTWLLLMIQILIYIIMYFALIFFLCFNSYEKNILNRLTSKLRR